MRGVEEDTSGVCMPSQQAYWDFVMVVMPNPHAAPITDTSVSTPNPSQGETTSVEEYQECLALTSRKAEKLVKKLEDYGNVLGDLGLSLVKVGGVEWVEWVAWVECVMSPCVINTTTHIRLPNMRMKMEAKWGATLIAVLLRNKFLLTHDVLAW